MTTAVCLASGCSLTQEDVEYCKGRAKIYAVKECRMFAPWADILYAADADWWDLNKGCPDFTGEKWTCTEEAANKWGLNHIPYDTSLVWSNSPNVIATGGNSGFQAVNLAFLQGATKIILLGYDMGHTSAQKHWWDNIYKRESRTSDYRDWIQRFKRAASVIPIPVINCTRGGNLDCFPRAELRESL